MDRHLSAGEALLDVPLDAIADGVDLLHAALGVHYQVQLDVALVAGAAGAQLVEADDLVLVAEKGLLDELLLFGAAGGRP